MGTSKQTFFGVRLVFFFLFFGFQAVFFGQTIGEEVYRLIDQKNYVLALNKLHSHINEYPNSKEAQELMGDIYSLEGNWEQARTYYEKLIITFPENGFLRYKYGGVLGKIAKEGSKFKAIRLVSDVKANLHKAAELLPKNRGVRWALFELYFQLPTLLGGSDDKALRYAHELEKLMPLEGYLAKIHLYEHMGNLAKQKQYVNKILESYRFLGCDKKELIHCTFNSPSINHVYYKLAELYLLYKPKDNRARFYFLEYISAYSKIDIIALKWAYLGLSKWYNNNGFAAEAILWIEEALKEDSDFVEALALKQILLSTQ
jgi:tetratricopeptide (TPR) repeat protein